MWEDSWTENEEFHFDKHSIIIRINESSTGNMIDDR